MRMLRLRRTVMFMSMVLHRASGMKRIGERVPLHEQGPARHQRAIGHLFRPLALVLREPCRRRLRGHQRNGEQAEGYAKRMAHGDRGPSVSDPQAKTYCAAYKLLQVARTDRPEMKRRTLNQCPLKVYGPA